MSKVAVIGAGIIGICAAHFLRKNGHQVTLYDQNEPGTQTSFGNAGLLQAMNGLRLTHLIFGKIYQACYLTRMVLW